jgi:NAD(P)-dependent dehydrogenase (short-subunit alcohol dehydrogenase family)
VRSTRLADKVAIITGAASGIGRAMARVFAQEGARAIVVTDRRVELGRETVRMIEDDGGTATFVQADVSRAADVKGMVEYVVARSPTFPPPTPSLPTRGLRLMLPPRRVCLAWHAAWPSNMASDESTYVTGTTLVVDGGLSIQLPEALVRPMFRQAWRKGVL